MSVQWPLVVFSLLAGCGGGLIASSGFLGLAGKTARTRSASLVVAIVLLVLGGCASVLHLAHPASIMAAAANIFSFSGISVELIMLGANLVVALVSLAMLRKDVSDSADKAISVVSILVGVVLSFAVGNGYVMEAQASWDTFLLPVSYMLSGLSCGSCLCMAICATAGKGEDSGSLGKIALALCALQLVAFVAYGFVPGFDRDPLLLVGGSIVVGSLGSLLCAFLGRRTPNFWWAAFACAVVGGLCLRSFMWVVGTGFMESFALAASRSVLGV